MNRPWGPAERALRTFNSALSAVCLTVSVLLLFMIVILVFANVIARDALETSIAWSGEVSVMALLWMVFLGAVVGYRRKMFPAFNALVDLLPARWARRVRLFVLGINIAAGVVLAGIGLAFALASLPQASPVLGISLGLVYLAIPIAGVAMVPISVELMVDAQRGTATAIERIGATPTDTNEENEA